MTITRSVEVNNDCRRHATSNWRQNPACREYISYFVIDICVEQYRTYWLLVHDKATISYRSKAINQLTENPIADSKHGRTYRNDYDFCSRNIGAYCEIMTLELHSQHAYIN